MAIPLNFLIRVIGIFSIIGLTRYFSEISFISLFVSFSLGHYALGYLYSKKQILTAIRRPETYGVTLLILLTCLLTVHYRFPDIVLYFGLHCVLTEVYWLNKTYTAQSCLTVSRFLLNFSVYLFILRQEKVPSMVPGSFWAFGLVLSIFYFIITLKRNLPSLKHYKNETLDICLFEAAGMIPVILSLFFRIRFGDVIFYHVIMWIFIPLTQTPRMNLRDIFRYGFLTACITGGFLLLTPLGGNCFRIPILKLNTAVILWGYVHITSSLMLSSFNPQWILRWFSPMRIYQPGRTP